MLYDHSGLRQIMKLGAIAEEIRDYLHVNKFSIPKNDILNFLQKYDTNLDKFQKLNSWYEENELDKIDYFFDHDDNSENNFKKLDDIPKDNEVFFDGNGGIKLSELSDKKIINLGDISNSSHQVLSESQEKKLETIFEDSPKKKLLSEPETTTWVDSKKIKVSEPETTLNYSQVSEPENTSKGNPRNKEIIPEESHQEPEPEITSERNPQKEPESTSLDSQIISKSETKENLQASPAKIDNQENIESRTLKKMNEVEIKNIYDKVYQKYLNSNKKYRWRKILCNSLRNNGTCKFGDECMFSHVITECENGHKNNCNDKNCSTCNIPIKMQHDKTWKCFSCKFDNRNYTQICFNCSSGIRINIDGY